MGQGLHLDEVEVSVQLETRGPEQSEQVCRLLTEASYTVTAG